MWKLIIQLRQLQQKRQKKHIYMKLEIDGKQYEVDYYLRDDGEHYKTSADGTEEREKVIAAFKELY